MDISCHPGVRPGIHGPLVIIGHVGVATDLTVRGSVTGPGGSGFAAAFAAAALLGGTGLVAQVGEDFDLGVLSALGIGLEGISVLPGASARFRIEQPHDGSLSFTSDLGVAAEPRFDLFPAAYLQARFVHLGSAPPRQQLAWLEFLRSRGCQAQVSVDMFEPFVATEPEACREACARADLIFLNEAEYQGLYDGRPHPPVPVIRKHGPGGAEYLAAETAGTAGTAGTTYWVPAPSAGEVDPIGAGEILAGAFLALRARGLAAEPALTYAAAAAARSVTEFGVAGPAVAGELRRIRAELGSRLVAGAP
ncbi:MAG TPA: carbohydrate kinase family protein [Streptosporangiaceae bacterium]|nr:carbohydrate kinase family protein [Streptosporangiaceae bacterium]